MCAAPAPQLPARWPKLAPPSELLRGLAVSRNGDRTIGTSVFVNNLAVPVQAYRRVGSPFDLSPSTLIHHNDLGALDQHPSTYNAFLSTRSRVVKVSSIVHSWILAHRGMPRYEGI